MQCDSVIYNQAFFRLFVLFDERFTIFSTTAREADAIVTKFLSGRLYATLRRWVKPRTAVENLQSAWLLQTANELEQVFKLGKLERRLLTKIELSEVKVGEVAEHECGNDFGGKDRVYPRVAVHQLSERKRVVDELEDPVE